jgi:dihydropteroate synthase
VFRGEMKVAGRRLPFGEVTHVMGVINVSPESKNPHTIATTPGEALVLARSYRRWGCDIIDLGAQSSHYDNPTLPSEEEAARLLPVVEALVEDGFLVSVDTWKPDVASAALVAGAGIVNDTGGLGDDEMIRVLDEHTEAAAVAVHVDAPHPHAVQEVALGDDKAERTAAGFEDLLAGFDPALRERVILDPGIAINYRGDYAAYTRLQMDVIRHSQVFERLQRPLLIPIPRKRDIHWVTAYITLALEYGADMIRVHDVAIAADLVRLWGRRP